MKDYQNAVVKMIDEVLLLFREINNKNKDQSILQKHVTRLLEFNTNLKKFKKIQEADIKGIFIEKTKAKKEISANIYKLTGSLRSFATDNSNDLLYKEVAKSKSVINKLADLNLVSYAEFVINKLNEYKTELVAYAISDKDIAELTSEIAYFNELLLKPAQMRKEVKVATANIKALITKMLNLLSESIDNDMLQYVDTKPELYKKYRVIREIDDSQTTALSIKGTVVDADGKKPLPHVKVTAKFKAGSELADKVKTTSHIGNFQFKGIPDGKCTVIFELEFYDKLVKQIAVYSNRATELDVVMEKTINNN